MLRLILIVAALGTLLVAAPARAQIGTAPIRLTAAYSGEKISFKASYTEKMAGPTLQQSFVLTAEGTPGKYPVAYNGKSLGLLTIKPDKRGQLVLDSLAAPTPMPIPWMRPGGVISVDAYKAALVKAPS